jgi:hypothetical protein
MLLTVEQWGGTRVGERMSGRANYRIVAAGPDGVIWAPEDRSGGDEIAAIIDRIHRERVQRRHRQRIDFSDLAAEEHLRHLPRLSMRPDEFLDAKTRRGVYVACRKVHTIDKARAREAGL